MKELKSYLEKNKIISSADLHKSFGDASSISNKLKVLFIDGAKWTDYVYVYYYTTEEYFEEFWLEEISYIFESKGERKISLDSILYYAASDVVNIFNIRSYNTIKFNEIEILKIIEKHHDKFEIKTCDPNFPK